MAYIARSLSALLERTPADKAIVVFGARQTGKTTLLEHLFQDRKVKWLSGDEPQDRELLTSLSSKADISILLSGLDVLVIDEAQRIQGIGMLLKRLEDSKPSCRIFATSSSSLELAGGVMESAAGRLWPMTLFPLSVTELANHNSWLDVMESLPIRLTVGSYPEIVTHPQRSKATLRYLFESIVFKDLFAIADIRRSEQFLHLVRLLAANIGNLCSFSSLGQQCGLSSPTVERCVGLLEQSFIVKTLPCHSSNFATELKKSKKIYFYDLGIRNAALDNFTPFSSRSDLERGALWENFVIIERLKWHRYRQDETQLYFWRDRNKSEVDLLEVDEDGSLHAFECKLTDAQAKAPKSFASKYPDASFEVITMQTLHRFFQSETSDLS